MNHEISQLMKEIREAAEKATPGEWKHHFRDGDNHLDADTGSIMCDICFYPWAPDPDDFAYIAAVNPANILKLMDYFERVERTIR